MAKRSARRKIGRPGPGRRFDGPGDTIVKRLTLPGGTLIAATGGGLVPLETQDTSDVQSFPATEWASFAARYQQYRVLEFRVFVTVTNPAAADSGTIAATYYSSDYIGSSVPASATQILSDEGMMIRSSAKDCVLTCDMSRNPNAKLWNPTSAAIPVANRVGIAFGGPPGAATTAGSDLFYLTYEWVVEFRGSQ